MSGVPSLNQELGKRGKGIDHVGLPSGRSVISRFFRCVIFRTIFLNHQAVLMKNLFSFPSSSLPQVHCQNRFKIRKERTKFMKNLIAQIQTKPALYQQSQANIWTDPYLSQKMLEAHLDEAPERFRQTIRSLDRIPAAASAVSPASRFRLRSGNLCGTLCPSGVSSFRN